MATGAAGCSANAAEPEALKLAFRYLVNSMDVTSLLPSALSRQLITQPQRSDCASELDPFKKADKFLGHLLRAVNGDNTKFHTFLTVLRETGQVSIASSLHGKITCIIIIIYNYFHQLFNTILDELASVTRLMQSTVTNDNQEGICYMHETDEYLYRVHR